MADLTPRERQALCLVTLTNRQIAARLGIKYQTVKNLLTKTYKRLGVSSPGKEQRIRALLVALRQGAITLDEIEIPPPVGWCWERAEQMRAAGRRECERCTGPT